MIRKINASLAASAILMTIAGCSSSAQITGGSDRAKKDPPTQQGESTDGGTTEETSSYVNNQNQDFSGTVDSTLISAAYLACGKLDIAASAIGCNAYEPTEDHRIPLESTPGISWFVFVNGHPVDQFEIHSSGRSISGLKLAMTARMPPGLSLTDAPELRVQLTLNGVELNFKSAISKLPPVATLGAFGIAKNFKPEYFSPSNNQSPPSPSPPSPSLSEFLKNSQLIKNYNKNSPTCMFPAPNANLNLCLDQRSYKVQICENGAYFSCGSATIEWDGRSKEIMTYQDCDAIAQIIRTEICN